MDDPAGMRMRERLQHLRRRLDRGGVVDLAGAKRLAKRLAGNVLVCGIDVAVVAVEREGARTAGVAKARGGVCLAFGSRPRLSLACDDLQRDVAARMLVAHEPYGARAAATEGAKRAVAPEDERARVAIVRAGRSSDLLARGRPLHPAALGARPPKSC